VHEIVLGSANIINDETTQYVRFSSAKINFDDMNKFVAILKPVNSTPYEIEAWAGYRNRVFKLGFSSLCKQIFSVLATHGVLMKVNCGATSSIG